MPRIEDYRDEVRDGFTLFTGPQGRMVAPQLRSYDEPLDVRTVPELFRAQRERDALAANPRKFRTGHFGPIVTRVRQGQPDLRCNEESCPCQDEDLHDRMARSL
jgi:hypothetical protein